MSGELKFPDLAKIFPQEKKLKPLQVGGSGDRPRVLLAEDDPVHSLTVFHSLAQAGYDVVVAVSGADAITELRKPDHPPVAVIHASLPEMDGLEISSRMRDADKDVYIILYSDQPTTERLVSGLESGADIYLPKAAAPELLVAQVKVGLRRAARAQAVV
jgi:DNA-binding response OmpR family regulator